MKDEGRAIDMKKNERWALVLVVGFAVAGCRHTGMVAHETLPPVLSPEQRREMQIKQWAASMDVVFSATLAEIQDVGWTLDSVDKASGIIRASTVKRLEAFGPEDEQSYDVGVRKKTAKSRSDVSKKWTRWMEAVIHIEPWGDHKSRQRIVLNLRGTLPSMSYLERQESSGFSRGRDVMINAPAVEQSVEVELPEAYAELFDRVGTGIAQRKAAGQSN